MNEFDAPGVTVAGLLRRCQRIASLRGDGIALAWLHLEATDVTNEFQGASEAKRTSLAARLLESIPPTEANDKWTAEYRGYIVRRRIESGDEEASLRSVQQIEGTVQLLRDQ